MSVAQTGANVARFIIIHFAIMALLIAPASAQNRADAALDPLSPMDEMSGLGVDWPDLAMPDIAGVAPVEEGSAISEARRYSFVIDGLAGAERAELLSRFNLLSTLRAGEGKPANAAQIDRRAREDSDLLDSILRAAGYYDADVEARVETGTDNALTVTLTAEAGQLYRFGDVQVSGLDGADQKQRELRSGFMVGETDAVSADKVILNREQLDAKLKSSGYPFAVVSEPEVVVDHDTQSATLSMNVETGGQRTFGQFRLSGNKLPFDEKHVRQIARFKSGEVYAQEDVEDLKRALIATGLVSSASVEPVAVADGTTADIAVKLEPAKLRTVAAEAGYGTGEGIRIEGSWTHRSLIRPEGAVTFRGVVGTREQYLGGVLRQSNFRTRDQVLNTRIYAQHQNTNAFDARTVEIGGSLERQTNIIWQKKWTWSGGFELIFTDEKDQVGTGLSRSRSYLIGALPLTLNYDGSDNLLDPTRGYRLGLRVAPELSLQGGSFAYVRAQLDASAYVPTGKSVVMAGRVRLGTIAGASSGALAPSRRFYAGGGGSVRGFGYQAIGPRDIANEPDGGRSLAEFSLEARVRFGAFGVVPFIDGGNIYSRQYPDFSGLRYGAGLGLRYYSNFGPIRIDVGTPLNRQKGDTRVTVFVSLGQAF